MCGITGWVSWEQDLTTEREVLRQMMDTLINRGPDAEGMYLTQRAALGHRRLIVVDPAGGAQPMTRRRGDQAYTIVYNGELYNTQELRQELESRGHIFYSQNSDTEVLLVSYMEWGTGCVDRLNGIFAFAVWDEAEQHIFLARDRLGVKPLFFTNRDSSFIFGSELKALLAHPAVQPEIDGEGLAELFVMGPSRTPGHGVFRGISEIRPGCCLTHDRKGTRLRQYWSLISRDHTDDLEKTAENVRYLFRDAVERQLVADVPVCALLSGGLDSSAIAAVAEQAFKRDNLGQLHTYSIDYTGNEQYFKPDHFQPDPDSPWARRVSEYLGTNHHAVEIGVANLTDALVPAVLANDLPGMADIDSSLLLFCQEIKKNATVALSGESADEVFGGYPWFHDHGVISSNSFPWIRMIKEREVFLSPELALQINPSEYLKERYHEALSEVPRLTGESAEEARMRELFYLNITRFMQTLLDRKDRMSMACGLEVRVPFCDHRLVEYVWNVPWAMKNCEREPKGLLRRAVAGILPGDVLARPKSPYPKTHNPDYLKAVCDWVLRILDDPGSPILDLVNVPVVRNLALAAGAAFDRPWFGQLMRGPQYFAFLIQTDIWLRHYRVRIV